MLTPSNEPTLEKALVNDLTAVFSSIRQTCAALGIDVEAAERSAARHLGSDQATLPWATPPKQFARSTRELLSYDLPNDTDVSDTMEILTTDTPISNFPQWSYLQAALTVDYEKWSLAARNAAISLVYDDPMRDFELALSIASDTEEQRDECEALKCWVVYNILGAHEIQKHPVSEGCKEIIDQMLIHDVSRLADIYRHHLQAGELVDSHPFGSVESILLKLSSQRGDAREQIGEVRKAWNLAVKIGGNGSQQRLEGVISDHLPDLDESASLDGERIASRAMDSFRDMAANRGLLNTFERLVEEPEWSNPLEAVRELAAQELHKIGIYAAKPLFSEQSIGLIHRIIEGMDKKPNLVFASSTLDLASEDSASIDSILDGLTGFLSTGRKSFAEYAGVSPANQRKLSDVVEALDLLRGLVGAERIHLVKDSVIQLFVEDADLPNGMLFAPGVDFDQIPTLTINLFRKDFPDERVASEFRDMISQPDRKLPALVAGLLRSAVSNYVVPSLAETHGGADQNGLVGFKPLTALKLAEQSGLINPLNQDAVHLAYVLQVFLVSDYEDQDMLDPIDVEDSSLTPSR